MSDETTETWRVVTEGDGDGPRVRDVIVELDRYYWHATCGGVRGPACGWQRAAVVRCMAEMHASVLEIVAPGESTRAEALAVERREREALVAAVRAYLDARHDEFDAETDPRVTPAEMRAYSDRREATHDILVSLLPKSAP